VRLWLGHEKLVSESSGIWARYKRVALPSPKHWSELPANFPAFRIKYEDVISGRVDFRALESWLEVKLNEDVALAASILAESLASIGWGPVRRWIVTSEAAAGMRVLGYSEYGWKVRACLPSRIG
jgi:hypothetical protein